MPFPTEFVVAPDVPYEADSKGMLISRMKQYNDDNPSPRKLRERYRDRRRRERATCTATPPCSSRPPLVQAMAMAALVMVCATSVAATVPLSDDSSSHAVQTVMHRALQTTAITNDNIKVAADECKAESNDYNCPVSQTTYGPMSTWDTSSVTIMNSSKRTKARRSRGPSCALVLPPIAMHAMLAACIVDGGCLSLA